MKKYTLISLLLISNFLCAQQSDFENYVEKISLENIKATIYDIASDSYRGRGNSTEEAAVLAKNFASQFEYYGLKKPFQLYGESSYLQEFTMYYSALSYTTFHTTDNNIFSGGMILSQDTSGTTRLSNILAASTNTLPNNNLMNENTSIMILIDNFDEALAKLQNIVPKFSAQNYIIVFKNNDLWRKACYSTYTMHFDEKMSGGKDFLKYIYSLEDSCNFIFLDNKNLEQLFEVKYKTIASNLEEKNSLLEIENQWFKTTNDASFDMRTYHLNAGALIEGKTDETIVITAHYDHLGEEGLTTFYGADDNASGTSAVMELARVFAEMKKDGFVPEKNILFLLVSAEEMGLYGSEYFVRNEGENIKNYVLNINLDMIGRSTKYNVLSALAKRSEEIEYKPEEDLETEDYVYVLAAGKTKRNLLRNVSNIGKKYDFQIDRTPGILEKLTYKTSSDHKNFYDKNVPILVFFTGLHPDYHTPFDTPEKIDYENLHTITKIIFQTILQNATDL